MARYGVDTPRGQVEVDVVGVGDRHKLRHKAAVRGMNKMYGEQWTFQSCSGGNSSSCRVNLTTAPRQGHVSRQATVKVWRISQSADYRP